MNSVTTTSENSILGLPRRPRGETLNSEIFRFNRSFWWAGIFRNSLANQSLKTSVVDYFAEKELEVTGFYRSAISIEVIFRFGESQYWSVKSVLPETLKLEQEDIDDWLYGNLIKKELPKKLRKIKKLLKI